MASVAFVLLRSAFLALASTAFDAVLPFRKAPSAVLGRSEERRAERGASVFVSLRSERRGQLSPFEDLEIALLSRLGEEDGLVLFVVIVVTVFPRAPSSKGFSRTCSGSREPFLASERDREVRRSDGALGFLMLKR